MTRLWRRFWLWLSTPKDIVSYYCACCGTRVYLFKHGAIAPMYRDPMVEGEKCYECFAVRPSGSLGLRSTK